MLSGVEIKSVKDGNSTVYTGPVAFSLISGAFGIVIGVAAAVYWMQRGAFHRLVSVVLIMLAAYSLFNSPTGLNHRLILTPDSFSLRIGSWYSPVDTKVEFSNLVYAVVEKSRDSGYEFRAYTRSGDHISVPACDLMKKAMPDILNAAAERGVVIGEGADGLQLPADFRK